MVAPAVSCVRRGAEVGRARREFVNLFAQQLETAAPDVFQIHSVGPERRALVKIDRDVKLLSNSLSGLVREPHAIFHRDVAHRHKRQNVCCAKSRVLARVMAQVNQLRCQSHGAQRSFDHHTCFGNESDDRAVMVGVHVRVEHDRAFDRFDGARQPLYLFGIAPLAKVGHAFDYFFHAKQSPQ